MSGMRLRRVLALMSLLATAAWADDVKTVAAAVDAHYNHLRTLQTEFTEVYRGSGIGADRDRDTLAEKPGKMRWEYRSPKEKLFVSDGKDAWFYVPEDRQARRTAAKKLDDIRSPLAFLLGKTKLEKELRGLSLAPDAASQVGNVVLRGVPQGMEDRISEILLEVTADHRIARIVIQEVDGSATEYRLYGSEGGRDDWGWAVCVYASGGDGDSGWTRAVIRGNGRENRFLASLGMTRAVSGTNERSSRFGHAPTMVTWGTGLAHFGVKLWVGRFIRMLD